MTTVNKELSKGIHDLPVAFSFEVVVKGANTREDSAFQEVSGLEFEMDIETVQEGGENGFLHRLSRGVKHPNLVLERGIVNGNGGLVAWCREIQEGGLVKRIKPIDIDVNLLNEKGKPTVSWSVKRAWPVKWSVSGFDAEKNALAIETIELAYNEVNRKEVVRSTV